MRLLVLLVILLWVGQARAESRPPFILILVPGLKAEDLTRPELQPLQALVRQGAYGWINARTARVSNRSLLEADGRPAIEAACLTINAGTRATARSSTSSFAAGFLDRLTEENRAVDHPVPIGALGDLLHGAKLQTATLGNSDDSQTRNLGRLIAMDSAGKVDADMTGSITRTPDSAAPYGFRDNLDVFAKPVNGDLQVWVFGDLWRAERYAPLCLPEVARSHRAFALSRLARLVEIVTPLAQHGAAAFLLVSPYPAPSASSVDRLAPAIRFGFGAKPGILYSPSTRTCGLITNTDILPTIAEYFRLKENPASIGRPVSIQSIEPEKRTSTDWAAMHSDWLLQSRKQSAFGGMPTLQLTLLIIGMAAWRLWGRSSKFRLSRLACVTAVSLLLLPVAQLLLPPLCPFEGWVCGLALALVVAMGAVGCLTNSAITRPLAIIAAGSLISALVMDIVSGQDLLRQAWMGYSVMEGARYYGIGNEYAGVALGAMGSLTLLAPERIPALVSAVALIGFGLLCGIPGLGADAGAMLAFFLAGAAVFAWNAIPGRRVAVFAVGIAAIIVIVVLLASMDAAKGGEQTHIGRASSSGIAGIIYRKAALNWYLLLHSPWSLCLVAALAGLCWVYRARNDGSHQSTTEDSVIAALSVGAAAMLVFNDSGVVAAANTLIVWWAAKMVSLHDLKRSLILDKREVDGHTGRSSSPLIA